MNTANLYLILKNKYRIPKSICIFIMILTKDLKFISYYTTKKYTEDIIKYLKNNTILFHDVILELFLDEFSYIVQQQLCHRHNCLHLLDKIDYTPINFANFCKNDIDDVFDEYLEKINYNSSYLFSNTVKLNQSMTNKLKYYIDIKKIDIQQQMRYIMELEEETHYDFIIYCLSKYIGNPAELIFIACKFENVKIAIYILNRTFNKISMFDLNTILNKSLKLKTEHLFVCCFKIFRGKKLNIMLESIFPESVRGYNIEIIKCIAGLKSIQLFKKHYKMLSAVEKSQIFNINNKYIDFDTADIYQIKIFYGCSIIKLINKNNLDLIEKYKHTFTQDDFKYCCLKKGSSVLKALLKYNIYEITETIIFDVIKKLKYNKLLVLLENYKGKIKDFDLGFLYYRKKIHSMGFIN